MENNFFSSALGRFRLVAILEGISYLVLLFIAMPMKYIWHMPLAVKYTGWAHGVLFVLYMLLLLLVWIELKWKFTKVLWAFVASLIPFGTFILDKQLQKE
jgi:integral membrane protein